MSHNIIFDINYVGKEYILELKEPLIFNDKFRLGIINFNTYYSIANINNSNNKFRYYNGMDWVDDELRHGLYNIDDINTKLNNIVNEKENLEDGSENIKISIDDVFLSSEITLNNNYRLDLSIDNGLNNVLGFNKQILVNTNNYSENKVNITNVTRAYLCVDIVDGMKLNNRDSYAVLSIPLNVYPGEMLSISPSKVIYYDIKSIKVERMRFWLMDSYRNVLDNQQEQIQFSLHIK